MAEEFGNPLKQLIKSDCCVDSVFLTEYKNFIVLIVPILTKLKVYTFNRNSVDLSKKVHYDRVQELVVKAQILHFFQSSTSIFAVDELGCIYLISPKDSEEDEDIFGEESGNSIVSWFLVSRSKCVPVGFKVITACAFSNGFCVLAYNEGSIYLIKSESNVGWTQDQQTFSLRLASGSCQNAVLHDAPSVSRGFAECWLKNVYKDDDAVVFVGLSNGSVYAVLPNSLKFVQLYKSIYAVKSLVWYHDITSNKFDSLLILLENGVLARLHHLGEDAKFPFQSNPFCDVGLVSSNFLVASSGYDLWINFHRYDEEPLGLPLVGVKALIPADGERFVCLTADGIIYLGHAERLLECLSVLPRDQLLLNSDHLQKLIRRCELQSSAIERCKQHLELVNAVSLSARSDLLSENISVSVKLVQLLRKEHTFRIKLSLNVLGITFSRNSWLLSVSICGLSVPESVVVIRLKESFSNQSPLVRLITVKLEPDILYKVSCKLVYDHASQPSVIIPLEQLDASHFLLPPSLEDLYVTETSSEYPGLTVEIPKAISLSSLISNSRSMWRVSESNFLSTSSEATLLLFGDRIHVSSSESSLTIVGKDPLALISFKVSCLLRLCKISQQPIILDLIGWYQAYDIFKYQSPTNDICEIYQIIKDSSKYFINDCN